MSEEFLFCVKMTQELQPSLIGGRNVKVDIFHAPYHLFHQDQFGPTISLCGKGRSEIAESTKILKTLPRGIVICPICKDKYMRTPLYQKWVKNAIPDRQRSQERTQTTRRSTK